LVQPAANLLLLDFDNRIPLEEGPTKRCIEAKEGQEDFDILTNQDCVDIVNYGSTYLFNIKTNFKIRLPKLKFFHQLVKSLGSLKYQ